MTRDEELRTAHERLEKAMGEQEETAIAKALRLVQSVAGLSKGNSKSMPGNDGFPNNTDAAAKIKRARGKSKPAKFPDGNFENLPKAEEDEKDGGYENEEPDFLGGSKKKSMADKTDLTKGRPMPPQEDDDEDYEDGGEDEEAEREAEEEQRMARKSRKTSGDFYKSLVADDPKGGEITAQIDATEALEHLATTMSKSIGAVAGTHDRRFARLETEVAALTKSMTAVATGLAALLEKESDTPEQPVAKSQAAAEATEQPAPQTGIEQRMMEQVMGMNVPQFWSSQGLADPATLTKSQTDAGQEWANLDTPEGRERVTQALYKGINAGLLPPDRFADMAFEPASQVARKIPAHIRSQIGLPS